MELGDLRDLPQCLMPQKYRVGTHWMEGVGGRAAWMDGGRSREGGS